MFKKNYFTLKLLKSCDHKNSFITSESGRILTGHPVDFKMIRFLTTSRWDVVLRLTFFPKHPAHPSPPSPLVVWCFFSRFKTTFVTFLTFLG
jgi:hypothetical protein